MRFPRATRAPPHSPGAQVNIVSPGGSVHGERAKLTPPIARVGAFFSIFRDLQDFHAFAPLRAQNFGKKLPYFLLISTEKSQKFAKFRSKFGKFSRNFAGISRKFRGAKGSRSSRVLPGFFRGSSGRSSVFFQADALHCAAF